MTDLCVGERVKVHPAADLFMRGVVYVTVVKLGRKWAFVQDDAGRAWSIAPGNLLSL